MMGFKTRKSDGQHFPTDKSKSVSSGQVISLGGLAHHPVNIKKANKMKLKKWGFDLTDFKPNAFQTTIKELGISDKPTRTWHNIDNGTKLGRGFVWKGNGILIETKNNPITGEYGTARQKENEKNYAGYIGITGQPDKVDQAVKLIKKNTSYRKGESPNMRDFI